MGAFSEIFGKVPKVLILETLTENSDDELTIREIIDETNVSKRGTYLIIEKLVKEGLVIENGTRPKKYTLNKNDLRALTLIGAEPLLIQGKLEYELKVDDNIPLTELYKDPYIDNNSIKLYDDEHIQNEAMKSYTMGKNEAFSYPAGA